MKGGYDPIRSSAEPPKAVASTMDLCATTAHTHSPPRPSCNSNRTMGVGVWNEIRSNCAFYFQQQHTAPNALGVYPFWRDGDLEGGGELRTGARGQDRFGLDLHIKPGRGCGPRGVRPTKGCARNSEFPLLLRPEACRTYSALSAFSGPESAGRLMWDPSVETPFPALPWPISQQYCVLDHRFPLLATCFADIGLAFFFSHPALALSLLVLSPLPPRCEAEVWTGPPRNK